MCVFISPVHVTRMWEGGAGLCGDPMSHCLKGYWTVSRWQHRFTFLPAGCEGLVSSRGTSIFGGLVWSDL